MSSSSKLRVAVCRDKKRRHYVLVVRGGDGVDADEDAEVMEERWKKLKAALATRLGLGRAGLNTLASEDVILFMKELERSAGGGGGGGGGGNDEGRSMEERVMEMSVTRGGAEIEDRVVVIVDEKAVWEGLDVHKPNVEVVDVDAPVKKVSVDSPGDLADVVKRLTAVKIHDGGNAEDTVQQQQAARKKKDGKKTGKEDTKAVVTNEAFRDSIADAVNEIIDVFTTSVAGYGNGDAEQAVATLRVDEDVRESLIDVVLGLKNAAYARGFAAATALQSVKR